jgi:serine/threonine-protein kinase
MKKWQQEEWQRVSRWYDEALTLAPEARAAWLAHLAAESGSMVAKLTELLSAAGEIETGDFLAAPPHLASHCPTDYSLDQVVGPYRLEALLGRGGMAEVWRASRIDGHLRREVALKLPFLPPQSAIQRSAWVQRFERERDILAGLRHPNVAALLDAGVADDGQAWLALEYVDGEPITAHCDSRRLGVRERLQLFRQVLLAMQHAHAHLVIHRDLKPGNILVTTAGEVRLLDFGIAKLLAEEQQGADATELTLIAGRPMTPAYASPEQVLGRSLTTASDIYSLGVLFYELICGLSPYDLHHSSTAEIERAILDADPRVPSRRAIGPEQAGVRGLSVKALRALLAPELDAIALRAMAKPPADRYPSADAMRADLDRWLHGEPVLARPPAAWLTVRKFAARHRFGVAAGATAFVALLAVTGMALVQRQQAQREASRAVASRDFLLEMFRLADPDQSRGAALTAKDLLEAGRKKAFEGLADQPELQADLLTAIGGVQADIGEMTHADTTFGQAIELYGREGRTRGLALTEILRADNARRLLDYRTAAEFLKRAEVHAAELGEDQEVQARLSLTQGRIWGGTGQLESAAKAFQSSVERTARLWGENDERTILALAGLAEMQSRMPGHGQDAVATLDEAFRRADRNPNLHPGRRADLEIFRVYVALDSGRYRVAHEQATGAAQR